jgi:hypothetical protein
MRHGAASLRLIAAVLVALAACVASGAEPAVSHRLPQGVAPAIGCWFPLDAEFAPGGYRAFLDTVSRHSAYNLLTTSLRVRDREITDAGTHAQIKEAVDYARQRGMGVVLDLDVRLARAAFAKAYPQELQEMLRLREVDLKDSGDVTMTIAPEMLSDHYTSPATPYVPMSGRLVRVYTYVRGPEGIEPESVSDVTASRCKVRSATAKEVSVSIACNGETRARRACVMVAFTHFAADVFAPHLVEFQRGILRSYGDVALAGVCKDEWGFPPCFDGCPAKNDYWFSRPMAEDYAKRTGGRDLVRDCLLMWQPERGRRHERQAAINQFQQMCWQRNGFLEDDFYMPATHATWWPNPDTREFKKNGLDWWVATRDWAQTDEVTPYCVRTSLAKKWKSPLWYNMYYSSKLPDYEREIWAGALSGGRVNFHPLFPHPDPRGFSYEVLLRGKLLRGDSRIRLLNFITQTPLDCPVAVIFGHACAMNWAGPAYDDVGLQLADGLARAGFPADLIPSDEIAAGAVSLGPDGFVHYGPQRYAAVVLYHPEFEPAALAAFFKRAAQGRTALFRVGDWTTDFDGKPFAGNAALPAQVTAAVDAASCATVVVERLKAAGIASQTPWLQPLGWDRPHLSPPRAGRSRLIDGTVILTAGEKDAAGDPIQATLQIKGHTVEIEAVGVAAIRLADDGTLEALAAGGLKHFQTGKMQLTLPEPTDLALWRNREGRMQGVVQDLKGPIPLPLAALTSDWLRLAVPEPSTR